MPKKHIAPTLPPLLAPYILSSLNDSDVQHNSLALITSTLAASPLWLLLNYLSAGFHGSGNDKEANGQIDANGPEGGVVVASFVREWEAWREGARRAVSRNYSF